MQYLLPFLLLILCALPAAALELPGNCRIHFTGSSTLHDFAGDGGCEPFVLQVKNTAEGTAMVAETVLNVPVAVMQTANDGRDEKMRAMFAADRFPRITGILPGGPLTDLRRQLHAAAAGKGGFPLRLRIREIETPVAAKVTRLADSPDGLSFDLEFPVSLGTYHLEPPSVLGLIKVADQVRVTASLKLAPLPTPWQP